MNPELQNKLYEKYPLLFCEKDLPPTQSLLCFGIETDDGWYDLLSRVCEMITHHEKYNKGPDYHPVRFTQVKEKYGTLRLYYVGGDDFVQGVISFAEYISGFICEETGNPGRVMSRGGWYKCLSPEMAEKLSYKEFDRNET
jgi:hypothetical protein